jgi:hypothetical protein
MGGQARLRVPMAQALAPAPCKSPLGPAPVLAHAICLHELSLLFTKEDQQRLEEETEKRTMATARRRLGSFSH